MLKQDGLSIDGLLIMDVLVKQTKQSKQEKNPQHINHHTHGDTFYCPIH